MSTMSRKNAIKTIKRIRDVANETIQMNDFISRIVPEVCDTEIDDVINGFSNGFLSEVINTIFGCQCEVIGEVAPLFKCSCCGFKTLTEYFDPLNGTGYDICSYCGWEDDGTKDAMTYSSVNKGRIIDYQQKIKNNPNKYYTFKWLK